MTAVNKEATQLRPFSVPPLPFGYDALEPTIDSETLKSNHGKLATMYVENLNSNLVKHDDLKEEELVPLLQRLGAKGKQKLPEDISAVIRTMGGGHWNYTFYVACLAPADASKAPSAELSTAIDETFGSMDKLKEAMADAAAEVFGAGWVWLGWLPDEGKLTVTTTEKNDNPLMAALVDTPCTPILGLDLWEHAYLRSYEHDRPAYLAAVWDVVNWDQVSSNFEKASAAEDVTEGAKQLEPTKEGGQQGSAKRANGKEKTVTNKRSKKE